MSLKSHAIILIFARTGQRIVFATYPGGNPADAVRSIAVDGKRNVYVHGQSISTDFPQTSPLAGHHSGLVDDFVAKLGPTGSTVIYSSVVGGALNESLFPDNVGIGVDSSGRPVLAGATSSSFDFPFVNAHDGTIEIFDAYVMRLSPTPEIDLTLGGSAGSPTFSVVLRNASPAAVDGQVKVYSRTTPASSPVALDLGTAPLLVVPSGNNVPLASNRPLPGAFTAGQVVTARWLDRVTGQVLAESICEEVPCQ
jgi:hypothetical protein